jgi:2-polyprenyl-6-methoxyphenol hydroxylase-like FAD-dependent oxidoreductase
MYKNVSPSDDIPYPNTWLIPQYRTDAILHERLSESGVEVEFNSQLVAFSQDTSRVTAKVKHASGQEEEIQAQYMIGADGGASTVRETLGISFPGKTDETDRMIIVDCQTDGLSRKYWHAWPGKKGRFTVACPLPGGDSFQWMIQLQAGEEPDLNEDALNARIQRLTKSKKLKLHDITWTSVFRPNIRLAEHYREGRIFVAGDAAHVHTPMGAQGLNTGVQDAYNLGWKLAQVIAGAPDALLDTYEAERQPVAASVLGRSTKKYEAAAKNDAESRKRGKDEQQLLITYRSGPLGRANLPGTNTLDIGDRAPDAKLTKSDGTPVRLFELYRGPHFTVLGFGEQGAQDVAKLYWPKVGARLERIAINAKQPPEGIDCNLVDAQASLAKIYGLTSDMVVLIRPDGYIGYIGKAGDIHTLDAALAKFTPDDQGIKA